VYTVFVESRLFGRPRCRWYGNIEMDLKEVRGMDWIHVIHDGNHWQTVVNKVMKCYIP
jgi:hypothetical protein